MKPIKIALASFLAGTSMFSFAACTACDGLPTWLGGKAPTYTVVIHIDGTETNMEVTEDSIPEKPVDPEREGYNFRGWYLDAAGETPYNFDSPLNADSTLYALFDEKEYVITYVVDGVSNAVTFKWSQTPTCEVPKKDGYVFKNWCLDEACTQDYSFTEPVREALTVYAKFAESYKVQYVVTPNVNEEENDGVNMEIVETEKETAPVKPKDPQVEGYTFEGWFLDKDFTVSYNFDTVLDPETTIYAKLVEKQYVITYMVGGTEDILSTVTYNYWTVPTQPETPTYNGEYFFGWYLDEEYKNSYDFSYTLKEDTTVYAQFLESKPIYTAEELQAIKDYPAGNYTLMNDIVLAGKVWTPIANFSGKLHGNGYKLIALTLSNPVANAGFIQTNTGTIKDLTIESYSFTANYTSGSYIAGALVGTNKGTIENCRLDNVTISYDSTGAGTSYLGAIVGVNETSGVIKKCWTNAKLTLNNHSTSGTNVVYVGGIVGRNVGLVENVFAETEITVEVSSNGYYNYSWDQRYSGAYLEIGGIVAQNAGVLTKSRFESKMVASAYRLGGNNDTFLYMGGAIRINESTGVVTECYSKGSIIEKAGGYNELAIGGFVQNNVGIIRDCYSDMDITTETESVGGTIGGFVSVNSQPLSTCYSIGSITTGFKGEVGGFAAVNNKNGTLNLCFASVDISSKQASYLGVFVAHIYDGSAILICRYNSEVSVLNNGEVYASAEVAQVEGLTAQELYSTATILNTLYWNTDSKIWVIDGENAPKLVWETTTV